MADDLQYLPILRWSDSIGGLTSRVDDLSLFNPTSWFQSMPNNISGVFLSMGNQLWAAAAWLEKAADSQKALDKFGRAADLFAGTIYNALTAGTWTIISLAFLVALVAGCWYVWRGQGTRALTRRLIALLVGLTVFIAMGAQSAAHMNDDPEKGSQAVFTPSWLAGTTHQVLVNAGQGVTGELSKSFSRSGTFLSNDHTEDQLSCQRYVAQLHKEASKTPSEGGDDDAAGAILENLSFMWEETGLRIWARAQYGPGENGTQVFCRILEYRAGATGEQQARLTKDASGVAAFQPNGRALAFNPDYAFTKGEKDGRQDSKLVDRTTTMWDVCGLKGGQYGPGIRKGFGFVNAIEGDGRGMEVGGADKGSIVAQCRAALAAKGGDGGASDELMVAQSSDTDDPDGVKPSGDDPALSEDSPLRALAEKFDVDNSTNWQAVAQAHNNGSQEQNSAAIQTIKFQQGGTTLSDIGGSILFVLAGLVALLVWGVGVGMLKIIVMGMAAMAAAGGVYLGALFYAFSPDSGRRAVGNACKWLVGTCAGTVLIGLFAAVGAMFVNVGLSVLGLVDAQSNTAGTVLSLTIASLLLPFVYVKLVRWLCVSVWKIGDPFSAQGLGGMMGLGMFNGIKTGAGMLAAGVAGLAAGGGIAAALSAAGHAAQGRGGILSKAAAGWGEGRREAYYDKPRAGAGGQERGHAPSEAEQAAMDGQEDPRGDRPAEETLDPQLDADGNPVETPDGDDGPAGEADDMPLEGTDPQVVDEDGMPAYRSDGSLDPLEVDERQAEDRKREDIWKEIEAAHPDWSRREKRAQFEKQFASPGAGYDIADYAAGNRQEHYVEGYSAGQAASMAGSSGEAFRLAAGQGYAIDREKLMEGVRSSFQKNHPQLTSGARKVYENTFGRVGTAAGAVGDFMGRQGARVADKFGQARDFAGGVAHRVADSSVGRLTGAVASKVVAPLGKGAVDFVARHPVAFGAGAVALMGPAAAPALAGIMGVHTLRSESGFARRGIEAGVGFAQSLPERAHRAAESARSSFAGAVDRMGVPFAAAAGRVYHKIAERGAAQGKEWAVVTQAGADWQAARAANVPIIELNHRDREDRRQAERLDREEAEPMPQEPVPSQPTPDPVEPPAADIPLPDDPWGDAYGGEGF